MTARNELNGDPITERDVFPMDRRLRPPLVHMLSCMILTLTLCIATGVHAARAAVLGDAIQPMNAADLRIALEKLREVKTVMYIAAHPDDENTALLAYFAKEKKYRTVYLSLTRGEGGQNILGTEKGADLGVIRTEELLAARRVDGAEQMFSRAVDFGFSKSSTETIDFWGREAIVGDIVWAIRRVRPDIIITRFSPTQGGHGNHTASAILAAEAFKKSGDSTAFPEQIQYVRPWKAKRLYYNAISGFGGITYQKQPGDREIDVGVYNPLLGLSYTEIAGISRSLHKTQAQGTEQRRGKKPEYFHLTDADSASLAHGTDGDLFAGLDVSWKRYPGGAQIEKLLSQAIKNFDSQHLDRILPPLLRVYRLLSALAASHQSAPDPVTEHKKAETASVIASCLGLHCAATTTTARLTAGEPLAVKIDLIEHTGVPVTLRALHSNILHIDSTLNRNIQLEINQEVMLRASIPSSMRPTEPYWLVEPTAFGHGAGNKGVWHYTVRAQQDVGLPENPDSLVIACELTISGEPITLKVPVRYHTIDPIVGELYRPVVIEPRIDVALAEKMAVWTHPSVKAITGRVVANAPSEGGTIHLTLPAGYVVTPSSITVSPMKKGEERPFVFSVKADTASVSGAIGAEFTTDSGIYTRHGMDLSYPHIVPQYVMHDAQLNAVYTTMRIVKHRIGYVMGSGDEVPEGLGQCGYSVAVIDDDTLERGSLSSYDAIVIGVRAYNVRERLRASNARLLDYVRNGGTVVVQYQTMGKFVESIGPYPFRISNDRVTDENAIMFAAYQDTTMDDLPHLPAMYFDSTAHADTAMHPLAHRTGSGVGLIMNSPNVITNADFKGWVQERGLYFANPWDEHYAAPFVCGDPGETPKQGSLIVTEFGKGYYCYTGLSFFRQLPAGVPGAFRLFGNLIELHQP